ncbi:TauD/TfdA family dioxygenase [Streptomyces sp. NPDC046261]|uniref:TauD/TfdA dioxygenase family protein n=1 Tax=Streptomyces sp. NPDC046261 TaxID=3157200 RepID=UPI0033D0C540
MQVITTDIHPSAHPDIAQWHTDRSFRPRPDRYTLLQGHVLPTRGGDTLFADMVGAHKTLPPRWKDALEGAVGTHTHALRGDTARHPVVSRVPGPTRTALYLSRLYLTGIHYPGGSVTGPSVD